MTEDTKNALGNAVRSARRRAGKSLQAVGNAIGYSAAYISKIELGQLPEGPSVECLRKLSEEIHVNFEVLEAMKAEMRQAATDPAVGAAGVRLTPLEEAMLTQFRRANRQLQEFLLAQSRLSCAHFGRDASGAETEMPFLAVLEEPDISDELKDTLAEKLIKLGNLLNHLLLSKYSLDAYRKAEELYRQTENLGELASAHHNMARAYFSLEANDPDLTPKRFDFLRLADEYFQKADQEFQSAAGDLTLHQRYAFAKNYIHWAYRDMREAILLIRQRGPALTDEDEEAIRRPYRLQAVPKRDRAVSLLGPLIEDLEQRPGSSERNELLARTLLQMGRAVRDVGIEKVLAKEMTDTSTEMLPFFRRSSQIRKRMVGDAIDEAERVRQLVRLANVHQELGYGFMRGCVGADRYAKALYQYEICRHLLTLAGLGPDAARMQYIRKLINTNDVLGEEAEEETKRLVSSVLDQASFGDLNNPILDYTFALPEVA